MPLMKVCDRVMLLLFVYSSLPGSAPRRGPPPVPVPAAELSAARRREGAPEARILIEHITHLELVFAARRIDTSGREAVYTLLRCDFNDSLNLLKAFRCLEFARDVAAELYEAVCLDRRDYAV